MSRPPISPPLEQPDYAAAPENPAAAPATTPSPGPPRKFLKRLAKYGCLADASRKTGVSTRTVYNHQDKDEAFARDCAHALRMAGSGLEQVAFERAVEGIDQLFACGGQVHVRKRYSDALLRLLLQGANRKKYGSNPGFSRKRLLAWERKQLKKEVEARFMATQRVSEAELAESIVHKLDILERRDAPARLAAGWTKDEDDHWIPPGWIRAPDAAVEAAAEIHETPRDSVRKS